MPLLYPWPNLLEFLNVVAHSGGGSSECMSILGAILLGVVLEVFKDEIGMAIQQHICLRIVAFCRVNLSLGMVRLGPDRARDAVDQHTSFCRLLAVCSQLRSGMYALYSYFCARSVRSCTLSGAPRDAMVGGGGVSSASACCCAMTAGKWSEAVWVELVQVSVATETRGDDVSFGRWAIQGFEMVCCLFEDAQVKYEVL